MMQNRNELASVESELRSVESARGDVIVDEVLKPIRMGTMIK